MASGSVSRHRKKWRARWREYPGGSERSRDFDRKVDAEQYLAATLVDLQRGTYVDPRAGAVTFRERAEAWRLRQVHRDSTAARVESVLRVHVYPVLGDRPISTIRKSDVQSLVKHLEGSLSASSVGIAYSYVAAVFSEAVEDRLLASTPCIGIKTPRATASQVTPLTVDQVQGMIEFVDERLRALVVVAAGTGLRQGEVCGLTVDRVKFLERRIVVDRQRNPQGGAPMFVDCKTPASHRVVPLPEVVAGALAEHLAKYRPGDSGLIFSTPRGGLILRNRIGEMWNAGRRAGIVPEWSTFHDLRHFYASLLIHHGESVKVVQARLGHSTAAETLDTYAHLWPDSEDDTRRAVDRALGSIAGQSRAKVAT